ncbi:MAG: ABC transporter substrate-binding protein [Anaerolineae bacterium]|nr:ABC transporter substrate-binding protein [Anaerolineae bacterium]
MLCSLLAAAVSLIACRAAAPVPRVVKIGLVGSFEGLYRSYGYEALYAVKAALAEWNERGGVAGHLVELVALDDSGSPEQAHRQPSELAADPDVLGVVGHTLRHTTDAALGEYARLGLPLVSPTAWTNTSHSEWVYFAGASHLHEALTAVQAAGLGPGARLVVVGGGEEWQMLSAWWAAVVSPGDPIPPDARAIVLDVPPDRAAEWVKAHVGLGVPLAGGSDLGGDVLVALAGDAATGIWIGRVAVQADAAAQVPFRQRYAALAGGEPGPLALVVYDATNVLLAAMERAAASGDLTRAGVARALRETDWQGLTGRIAFAGNGVRAEVNVEAVRLPLERK